ncbi:DmsC/YnfH family molybdoenzyme membrane anchor subunit [Calycomorphotria hydatis]|uniref:Anaerobic dimethyl sulfoxide reductase chain B n=1 Tax=Calycomorphotria hydatis TaxID=2528027 RepID=A0A517TA05_9PLAN|nr:DmsC/YnfH family molybdoenzyme membrane anchor subunit [Calycomorphotria hydatis]QDT65193.1 Anaerobic dimethyl sulfoxide reductase chain B [Calycomorphotria hydatis]
MSVVNRQLDQHHQTNGKVPVTNVVGEEYYSTPSRSELLATLLDQRHDLTAVERFSQFHADATEPALKSHYQSLLPASAPAAGQQYGFEVDLDRCSGCKACVVACHTLNGLDEQETWRDVGLLIGDEPESPVTQHVTTACHHCVDPGCMSGCPTDAYEKDPVTGIVRHLDDQCFGCQYCTLACPYDVPKYHAGKGIVRKCDMCSDRLAEGEAPACVQACPHEAIAIRIVDTATMTNRVATAEFLPASPAPDYTHPSTVFKTERQRVQDAVAADRYDAAPEHAHWPLVVMLVLTQLSVGGFSAYLGCLLSGNEALATGVFALVLTGASLALGLTGLTAALFHLGRPLFFFRAIIGWKHSWLSREALVFGAFAGPAKFIVGIVATNYFAAYLPEFIAEWLPLVNQLLLPLAATTVLAGAVGIFCSGMIYHFVRRPFWRGVMTFGKFYGTAALGIPAIGVLAAAIAGQGSLVPWWVGLALLTSAKLVWEAAYFRNLNGDHASSSYKSAKLMLTRLKQVTLTRFASSVVGGVLIPLIAIAATGVPHEVQSVFSVVSLSAICLGELSERYLYFSAVVKQKMPGGLTA